MSDGRETVIEFLELRLQVQQKKISKQTDRIVELEEVIKLALEYPLEEVMRQTAHRQLYNAVHKDKPLCSRCLYRHAGECL